jgi:hypothetical protein
MEATMTVDELTKLLCDHADEVQEAREVPDDLDTLLRLIAEWMHISEEGFAASDVRHMILECRVLIATLAGVRNALAEMLPGLADDA